MRTRDRLLAASVQAGVGILLTAAPAGAQGVTGAAVHGQVFGPDSVPIAEATVLVSNTSNGERWRAVTTAGGGYQMEHLSVGGPYRIEVQGIGFQPVRRDGVFLSLGQRLRADFILHEGVAVLQPITVHATDDPLINSGRTGPSQIVSESTLARLPVPDRNILSVARLSPVVTGDGSVAGQNSRLNAVQVDGASGGDLLGGLKTPGQDLGLRTVPVEAVKEVQVLAAPFDVRYGGFAAGLVNVVTKSGSNSFQGSLSGYFASDELVGKDQYGSRGDEFSRPQVYLTLGGPIRRDRAAFFVQGSLEHFEDPVATPIIGRDTTGGADSVGVGFRRASVTQLQEVMREVYAVDAGDTDPVPLTSPIGNLFGKVTVQLGVNSRLELSHNYSASTPNAVPELCRKAYEVFCLGSTAFHLPQRAHITHLSWVTAPGSGLSNDLLLAWSRYRHECRTTDFPLVFVHADTGDLGTGGNALCNGDFAKQEVLELTDNLLISAGAHRLTFGAHGELINLPTHYNLLYGFSPSWHFQSIDSLAAGLPDTYGGVVENPARAGGPLSTLRTQLISPYVQDQWNVTPKLVLTLGLRVDVPFVSGHPQKNPALQEEPLGIDNTKTPGVHLLWSPRLGMSYDLHGEGRTFLRGGIGLFAGRPAYRWFDEVFVHTGLDAIEVHCNSANVPRFVTDADHQPSACTGSEGVTPIAGSVNVFDPEFRFPRTLKVALGADHRLPWDLVGTVDLLFSRGVDQLDLRELNLAPSSTVATGEANRALYGTVGEDGFLAAKRLSPAFGRVTQVRNAHGDRSFSVTGQLQKHLASGKELSASYTYTAARDLLSATEDALDANLDVVILDGTLDHRRLAPSAWGPSHRVTLMATADLPLHFRMTLFYEGISGGAFTYNVDGDANGDGYLNDAVYVPRTSAPGGDIALVVDDEQGNLLPAPASEYAELDHFIEEEPCLREHRGRVLRRNSCHNPWGSYTNARFSKVFPAARGRSLEVGLDVFNLLHLFDSDWGLIRGVDATPLLQLAGYDATTGRGTYRRLGPTTRAVIDGSQWRMQLGARCTY